MRKFYYLAMSAVLWQLAVQGQNIGQIKTIIQPQMDVSLTYTYSPISTPLRMMNPTIGSHFPIFKTPSWGVSGKYETGQNLIQTPIGNIGMTQAFQFHGEDTFSVFILGEHAFPPNYLLGIIDDFGNIDTIMNLRTRIDPDPHGIAVRGNYVYHCLQQTKQLIVNDEPYNVIGSNILRYDLQNNNVDTIFNWFESVPVTMMNTAYWDEMVTDSDIDWSHFNWVDFDYDGNLLVSWRHLGFTKIDKNTGEVIWWGGLPTGMAQNHGFNEVACVSGDCLTRLNHNIKPFPNQPNKYMIYDNGDIQRMYSRALIFSIVDMEMTVEEEYFGEFSPFMGSVDVWEGNAEYLLVNTPTIGTEFWFDSLANWLSAQTIEQNLDTRAADAGSLIRLIDRQSGSVIGMWKSDSLNFVYSSELLNIDLATMLSDGPSSETFSVYPNPTTGIINLPSGFNKLFDSNGRWVAETKERQLDIREQPNGVYVILNESGNRFRVVKI